MRKSTVMSKEAKKELDDMLARSDRIAQQSAQLEAYAVAVWTAMNQRINQTMVDTQWPPKNIRYLCASATLIVRRKVRI